MSQRFLDLATQLESLSDQLGKVREQLTEEMKVMGVNKYVQDPATGLVYKIVVPNGTFTYFKQIDYVRTAKPDERQGTLSKKEAQEQGFVLPEKK